MLNYARHFGLLALFAVSLATVGSPAGLGIDARFALYGALHAAALVMAVGSGSGLAPGRRLLFVALAAILALANARLGLFGLHAVSAVGGSIGPLAIVAACAGLGALAYAALINAILANRRAAERSGLVPFDHSSLAATSLGCAAVTTASFAVSRALHSAGVLGLAIPWWFAFSALLWYVGRRRA
jgi:hypothetical protein